MKKMRYTSVWKPVVYRPKMEVTIMAYSSSTHRYINSNIPKSNGKYDIKLIEFSSHEKEKGMSRSTVSQHRNMVLCCLKILKIKTRITDLRKVTPKHLDKIKTEIELLGKKNPVSFVRVFASFISFVTGNKPLIDIGKYGSTVRNDVPLIDGTVSEGDRTERERIIQTYGVQLSSFTDYLYSKEMSASAVNRYEMMVCTCLYTIRKKHPDFETANLLFDDLRYVELILTECGVPDIKRIIKVFALFTSVVTGNEPLIDTGSIGVKRPVWYAEYRDKFPFRKELEVYKLYLLNQGTSGKFVQDTLTRTKVGIGILKILYGITSFEDIKPDMFANLQSELLKNVTQSVATKYLTAASDFISYFAGNNLYAEYKSMNKNGFPELATDDYEFKKEFYDYLKHMEDWGIKAITIKNRASAIVACYTKLKEIYKTVSIEEIMPTHIHNMRNAFPNLMENTIRVYLYTFCCFIKYVTGRDIYRDAKLRWNGDTAERLFISHDTWQKLYSVADTRERLILSLGATMGLRRNEILKIKIDDISDNHITITGKGTGNGKIVTMDMSELVAKNLKDYLSEREDYLTRCGDRSKNFLLINTGRKNGGRPLSVRALETIAENLKKKSGVLFTIHSLRRLYCTTMSDCGVDLDTMRRMMRHSSQDTTVRYYLCADPRKIKLASERVNEAFSMS